MFNETRRNNWSYIIDLLINTISQLGLFILVSFLKISEGGVFVIPVIIVLSLIVAIIGWINKKFYLDGEGIVYTKGIIFKKKMEVPFNKINTVDIKRNLIDMALGVALVKIDSGAVKQEGEEIKIKLKGEEATELKKIILMLKRNNIKEDDIEDELEEKFSENEIVFERRITLMELVIYAITKGKLLWSIGGFFLAMQFAEDVDNIIQIGYLEKTLNFIGENITGIGEKTVPIIILTLLISFIIIYIFINIIFIIFEIVRLYNFTVKSDLTSIYISYGLFSRKEYSVPINKIHALRFKQGLLHQMLNVFNLECIVIGYGDEKDEQAIIYPIADEKFIKEVIVKLLPDFKSEVDLQKPPSRALSRFIIKRSIILGVILGLTFFIGIGKYIEVRFTLFVIILLINAVLGYINYRNTSLGVNGEIIRASEGSLLKSTTIIKQTSVQSVKVIDGPFHRRKGVYDFEIDIYTNKLSEAVMIRNMDKSLEKTLLDNLIM